MTHAKGFQIYSCKWISTATYSWKFIAPDATLFDVRGRYIGNSADNQFMVVADGGTIFYSNSAATAGVKLACGGGSWTAISDRNAKTAVYPVNGREVLEKVAAMPLNTWQYKAQGPKYRHMGPMAQDFYAAFHLGESDTGIDTIDADGVALAAIQGLYAELNEKNREIVALRSELETQKSHVAALESLAGDFAEMKVQIAALRDMSMPAKMTAVSRQP